MRISLWKQDQKGKRWRRIGVIEAQLAGAWPFKAYVSDGEFALPQRWPRFMFHTMEVCAPSLFSDKGATR